MEENIFHTAMRIGVAAGIEAARQQNERNTQNRIALRIVNTKKLLKNYRGFKFHALNSIKNANDAIEHDVDLIAYLDDRSFLSAEEEIQSICNSATRTALMVSHIDTMLTGYQKYCEYVDEPEEWRRYRVVNKLYIGEEKASAAAIAEKENIDTRTVYKDVDSACEKIAALVFGV